ncbi:hypothetical protein F4809DRAFT_612755 [Biscogniauxia mediterranea]|nr:hypothetical protein F4809DRAFT_612755 [Biscogniauxia mediterranea]
MASPLYLPGHWHQYTEELLSLVGGEVTMLLVRLTPQPDDMPILPGQDPDTHRALGIEMSQRLIAAGLGPIFLIDTHDVVPNPQEAVARYEWLDNRPCIHIGHVRFTLPYQHREMILITSCSSDKPWRLCIQDRLQQLTITIQPTRLRIIDLRLPRIRLLKLPLLESQLINRRPFEPKLLLKLLKVQPFKVTLPRVLLLKP